MIRRPPRSTPFPTRRSSDLRSSVCASCSPRPRPTRRACSWCIITSCGATFPGAWASPAGARRSVASPRRGPRSCCAATTTRRAPSCSTGGWWSRRRAHCAGAHAAGDRPASTSSPSSRRRSTSPFSGGTPSAAAFGRRTHTRSPEPDASHQHNRSQSPVKFQDTKSQAQHRFPEAHMAPKFRGVDFYEVDGLLAEEERAVRDTVRAWVDDNLIPVIGEHYLEGKFPKHLVPHMAELGLFGAYLPEAYGCAGLNNVAYGLIMQELERGDSGVRSFASVQGGLVMYPIHAFGSEDQKQQWLPRMASGQVIGCFGLTEPDYGSNPGAMTTTARETRDGWVLRGAKMWSTNGSTAPAEILWAKTGDLGDADSIRGFIVPTDAKGFSAKDQKGKLSLRASDTSELVLEDVCVPKEALLPKSGGLKSPLMCLTQARYGIAWGAVGAAMACYDEAVGYAKTRAIFGKPIGGFQLQQARLAEMLTEVTKAQLLCLQLGRLKDQGKVTAQQVSLAKRNNVNIATDIARETRRLLGANGILAEYQAMRHLANLESVYTYEGTHDIHTLILGQEITGLNAFN